MALERVMAARGAEPTGRRDRLGGRRRGARARRRVRRASSTPRRSRRGELIPLLFGSAAWNFGVGLLLDVLRELAPSAQPRATRRRHAAAGRRAVRRARVQGPGQHGPAPPRPGRVRADLLRPVRARDAGQQRAHRAHARAELRARGVRAGPRRRSTRRSPGDVVGVVIGGDVRVGDTLLPRRRRCASRRSRR